MINTLIIPLILTVVFKTFSDWASLGKVPTHAPGALRSKEKVDEQTGVKAEQEVRKCYKNQHPEEPANIFIHFWPILLGSVQQKQPDKT